MLYMILKNALRSTTSFDQNALGKGWTHLKKAFTILIAGLLIVSFASCKKAADESAAVSASNAAPAAAQQETELPNPIVEVEGSADFYDLGFIITPHQQADDVTYSIINGSIAQIIFTLNRETYTYRAAETASDISGVYESFDPLPQSLDLEGPDFTVSVLVRTIGGGERGALAIWALDGVSYSFFTPDQTDFEALTDVLLPIIYMDLPFAACSG